MRSVAQNIVGRLIDVKAVTASDKARCVAEVQRLTEPDYIPGGGTVNVCWNLRSSPPGFRCGCRVGEDIQSGPFYCGEPGTLMGDTGSGLVVTCQRHEGRLGRIAKADGES